MLHEMSLEIIITTCYTLQVVIAREFLSRWGIITHAHLSDKPADEYRVRNEFSLKKIVNYQFSFNLLVKKNES